LGFRCVQQSSQTATTAVGFDRKATRNPKLHIVSTISVHVEKKEKMEITANYPINEFVLEEMSSIFKNYKIAASKRISSNGDIEILIDSIQNKCRFCGKSYPDVKFKFDAHSIPEFMGNKSLFSKFECDTCNLKYFNRFENEMANFMLPHNAFSGIKVKKNKIPKYNQEGQPKIENNGSKILLTNVSDTIFENHQKNNFEISIKIPSYIPDFIYRCLVKIALNIISEDKLSDYNETLKWLMNKNSNSNIKPFMLFSIYPYNIQSNEIFCILFELKTESEENFPHSIFSLAYKNFAFQTYLPYHQKERLDINLKAFPFIIPTNIDLNKNYKDTRTFNLIDLSSKEKTSEQIITFTISGEIN
jgi:hypothetical protein